MRKDNKMDKVIVAITGGTGNMGQATVPQILELDQVEKVKLLVLNSTKDKKEAAKYKKKYGDRVEIIYGNIANIYDCKKLVKDAAYVINMAAVIPPTADYYPEKAIECNYYGAKALVHAIEEIRHNQPKFIHISTVATYGNRDYQHPWGECADPLLPSVYDSYGMSKVKGELVVMESKIEVWSVIRQTGMLHKNLFKDNLNGGLMFHTPYNVPMEWSTQNDSGLLLKNIIKRDLDGEVDNFWRGVYNLGCGDGCRITGYDTFEQGFSIISGSTEKFMKPNWNATRNFHCMFFLDSDVLENMFHFQRETVKGFWQQVIKDHPIFALAKGVQPALISELAIKPLLKDSNSPRQWLADNDEGRVIAAFGSKEAAENLPEKWEDFPVFCKGKGDKGEDLDYEAIKDIKNVDKYGFRLKHGYDETKPTEELDIEDMQQAAEFRGGQCLSPSMEKGNLYKKLKWECADGHKFKMTPFAILKAGHWCPECCETQGVWNFDHVAKKSPFHAQIWYDTHAKDENYLYWYDDDFNAHYKKTED